MSQSIQSIKNTIKTSMSAPSPRPKPPALDKHKLFDTGMAGAVCYTILAVVLFATAPVYLVVFFDVLPKLIQNSTAPAANPPTQKTLTKAGLGLLLNVIVTYIGIRLHINEGFVAFQFLWWRLKFSLVFDTSTHIYWTPVSALMFTTLLNGIGRIGLDRMGIFGKIFLKIAQALGLDSANELQENLIDATNGTEEDDQPGGVSTEPEIDSEANDPPPYYSI